MAALFEKSYGVRRTAYCLTISAIWFHCLSVSSGMFDFNLYPQQILVWIKLFLIQLSFQLIDDLTSCGWFARGLTENIQPINKWNLLRLLYRLSIEYKFYLEVFRIKISLRYSLLRRPPKENPLFLEKFPVVNLSSEIPSNLFDHIPR